MKDLRTAIKWKGIAYFLTFEQINEIKRASGDLMHINDYFDRLPYAEKRKVRPDWKPADDDTFYPDPEPEY